MMHEKLIRMIAQSPNEQKLPVVDILKMHEDSRNPDLIDTNT